MYTERRERERERARERVYGYKLRKSTDLALERTFGLWAALC